MRVVACRASTVLTLHTLHTKTLHYDYDYNTARLADHAVVKTYYSETPPHSHLVIITTFMFPERIESSVIYLVFQPC